MSGTQCAHPHGDVLRAKAKLNARLLAVRRRRLPSSGGSAACVRQARVHAPLVGGLCHWDIVKPDASRRGTDELAQSVENLESAVPLRKPRAGRDLCTTLDGT